MKIKAITATAAVLAATACGSATTAGTPAKTTASSAAVTTSGPTGIAASNPYASLAPTPVSQYVTPSAAEFTVTLKILTKQCFGSAGCNITYRPELSMDLSSGSLDPSVTYDVTYEVIGGDSGPVTDTLTVTGDQYSQPGPQDISTTSQGTALVAKVTDVAPE